MNTAVSVSQSVVERALKNVFFCDNDINHPQQYQKISLVFVLLIITAVVNLQDEGQILKKKRKKKRVKL